MKRVNNNNVTKNSTNIQYQKNTGSTLPKNSSITTNNTYRTPGSSYSSFQKNSHGFLPTNHGLKQSTIVSPAVAQQADRVFGPRIINSTSVSSLGSPQAQVTKPLMTAAVHSTNAGVLSKNFNITSTGGTAVQTSVTGSPVPQFLSDRGFFEFVSCSTTAILAKKYGGDPTIISQLAILHAYAKGNPGRNIVNFQNMAATLNRKIYPFAKMDVTNVIAAKDLDTMPPQHVDKLKKLPGTRLVNVEESMVLPTINPALDNKLILRDETKPLSTEEKLSNLSGNSSPDFKLEHPVSCRTGNVNVEKDVFFDLKNSESDYKEYNQIRAFTNNLEGATIKAQEYLKRYLLIRMHGLAVDQQSEIKNFTADIDANLEKFEKTGNVTEMIQDYNHLLDKYGSWLAGNDIPMNLVTKIGLDSFILNDKIKQDYLKVWNYLATSPNSPAKTFCLSHFQTYPKAVFNDSFILVKPFINYLENEPHFKDIVFE